MSRILVIISLLQLQASLAAALPWTITPPFEDASKLKRLQDRYPEINSAGELQSFLSEVERISFNKKLEANVEQQRIIVRRVPTKPIRTVKYNLVTREFMASYEAIAQKYLGLAYSVEAQESLKEQLVAMLQKRGFYLPSIRINMAESRLFFDLDVKISEGEPCLIQSIDWQVQLPSSVDFSVKEGDICDQVRFQRSVRELEEELVGQGYKQVRLDQAKFRYDPSTNTSIVSVPGYLGRVITYEIIEPGEQIFSIEDLFDDAGMGSLDPTVMTPDAVQSELVRHYRNRGYVDIAVSKPKIVQTDRDKFNYLFEVEKGQQYRISSVVIEGMAYYSEKKALELLGLRSFWQGNKPLNLEEIREGIENLKANYQSNGYWDVNIREPRITKTRETGLAQIVILVNEGRQRFLREISYSRVPKEWRDRVQALSPFKEGQAVDRNILLDFESAIRSLFLSSGYLYVDVKVNINRSIVSQRIALSMDLSVDPNVRVKIGTISVKGLIRTKEKVILRELWFASDDWYNPAVIDKSRRALLSLGLFQSVQIQQSDINAINEKMSILDITVTVKESKPGNVRFGPGWSLLRGGRFSIESSYNNIGGVGRQIFMRANLSEEAQQDAIGSKTLVGRSASVGFLEPYIFNLPLSGTVSLNHLAYADDVWIFSNRGELAVSHQFRDYVPDSILTVYYGQRINDSEGTQAQQEATIATPQTRVGFIGLRYNWDKRDNVAWPTRGFYFEGDMSWARYPLGGELQYFYWSTDTSVYKQLNKDFVFAFGLSLAAYNSIKNKDADKDNVLPSAQLLHLDGTRVVRGFRERSLGPTVSYFANQDGDEVDTVQEDNEPGGTHRILIRNEIRYQIIDRTLASTFFVDLGTVFFSEEELDRFRTTTSYIRDNEPIRFSEVMKHPDYLWKKQYASYGLSLNYLTPVGSVNLAYGLPWKRCTTLSNDCEVPKGKFEDYWLANGEFHINVGATF